MPTTELGSRRKIGKAADETLLETVQRQTFRYFWDFAHPTSGLAYDRVDPGADGARGPIAVGGSGFGVMAIIVAASRRWISHAAVLERDQRTITVASRFTSAPATVAAADNSSAGILLSAW